MRADAAELDLHFVDVGAIDSMLAVQISDRDTRLLLLQDPDNLPF